MADNISELQTSAKKNFAAKKYSLAAEEFLRCAQLCSESGDVLLEAEMRNNCSVSLLMDGKAQQAYEAALGTDRIFAEHSDIKRQAMSLGNIAAALEDLKDYQQSFDIYVEADELLRSINENELRSMLLKRKAFVQTKLGKNLEAAATLNTAIEAENHPSMKEKAINRFFRTIFPKKGE